jgi:hypothetical protein
VPALKKVSCDKFDEIHVKLYRFLESRDWERTFRLRSLDEDEGVKSIIELFEKNSIIKGSVGDASIYVISIYCHNPRSRSGKVFVASLVVERGSSGYTVKIGYGGFDSFSASSEEEVAWRARKKIGGFTRLLEKALSIKHPNAPRLAELIECLEEARLIDFLWGIYGDEVLDDEEVISGVYRVCFGESDFFINDRVIVIPSIGLFVARDKRSDKIFRYDLSASEFREVPPRDRFFYDVLPKVFGDLLKPEFVVKAPDGDWYMLSSSEAVVDGRRVSFATIGTYLPKDKRWFLHDIVVVACEESAENECSIYSFRAGYASRNIRIATRYVPLDYEESFLRYILGSEKTQRRAREWITEELAKEYEWEILPA